MGLGEIFQGNKAGNEASETPSRFSQIAKLLAPIILAGGAGAVIGGKPGLAYALKAGADTKFKGDLLAEARRRDQNARGEREQLREQSRLDRLVAADALEGQREAQQVSQIRDDITKLATAGADTEEIERYAASEAAGLSPRGRASVLSIAGAARSIRGRDKGGPGLILNPRAKDAGDVLTQDNPELTRKYGTGELDFAGLKYFSPENRSSADQAAASIRKGMEDARPRQLSADEQLALDALEQRLGRKPSAREANAAVEAHHRAKSPGLDPGLYAANLSAKRGAADELPPRTATRVDGLSRQFSSEPVVKRYQTVTDALQFVRSIDPESSNPADNQALIYAFAKAMDPDSVVREGEYATVQKYAQSWADNFGFNALRVFNNQEFLSPKAVRNMKATIEARSQPVVRQYRNLHGDYATRINKVTGRQDGTDYLPDHEAAFREETPAGTGTTGDVEQRLREKLGLTKGPK